MTTSFGLDWSRILRAGGIEDSPGRDEAVAAAQEMSRLKREAKHRPKSKGKSKSKPTNFPSLKHAKDVM